MSNTPANMPIEEIAAIVQEIAQGNTPAPTAAVPAEIPVVGASVGEPIQAQPAAPSAIVGLKTFVSPEQLKKDISFTDVGLDGAIREHAAMFVHYASLAAMSRRQYENAKLQLEVGESRLYAHHREQMAAEGKKVTEAQVDAAVKADPRYVTLQKNVIDARAIHDLSNDAREAFSQRKDMLVQLAVDRRTEREGELRIKAVTDAQAAAQSARGAALSTLANVAQQAA